MEMLKKELEEEKKRTIIFRTYNKKAHKIDWIFEKLTEIALKPSWEKFDIGSVEVVMEPAEIAQANSYNPIKMDKVTLILLYMGRWMAKV